MRIKQDGTVFRLDLESPEDGFETRISLAVNSHGAMVRPRVEFSRHELADLAIEAFRYAVTDNSVSNSNEWYGERISLMLATVAQFMSLLTGRRPETRELAKVVDWRFLQWFAPEGIMKELAEHTYAVQYSPNCPSPFLVRLVGKFAGKLDYDLSTETKDILGYGQTFEGAATEALAKYQEVHAKQ
jgi:hypothetical protein